MLRPLANLTPGLPSLRRDAGQEVVEKRGKHLRLSHEYEKFDHHRLASANVKSTANGYGNRIRNRKRQRPDVDVVGHVFREYTEQKRDEEQQKVPGRIAIMVSLLMRSTRLNPMASCFSQSPSADSRDGKSIATLSLSSGTDKPTNGSAFVLNASGTNATQVYLVPASSQNQTQPGESTPEYQAVEVHLHIEAAGNDFCATFDPNPPKPAPLTAEQCTNGAHSAHKSQIFAYYPESGAIRPMWYDGEETDDDDEDPTPDDDGSGYDGVNNSTTSDQDPGTPTSSKVVGVTSLATNTRPPALLKSFIAESNPQNVTLVFQPILGGNSTSPSSNSTAPATNSTSSSTTLTPSPTPSPSTFAAAQIASVSVAIPGSPTTSASSSTSSVLSSTSSGSSMPAPSPTSGVVDIEVFNPYAVESSATTNSTSSIVTVTPASSSMSASISGSASANVKAVGPSSSIVAISSGASSTVSTSATASSTESVGATASASPSMTAVSTAPYDWMFKEGTVRDQ